MAGFFDGGWFGGSDTTAGGSLGDTSRYSLTGPGQDIPPSPWSDVGQARGVQPPYGLDGPGVNADPSLAKGIEPGFAHLDDAKLATMREDDAEARRKAEMATTMFTSMFVSLAKAGADAYSARAMRGKQHRPYEIVAGGGGGPQPQISVDNPLAGMNLG